jgi:hypothetical protein
VKLGIALRYSVFRPPPEDLLEISMYDPSAKQVERFIGRLVKAVVDIRSSSASMRRATTHTSSTK